MSTYSVVISPIRYLSIRPFGGVEPSGTVIDDWRRELMIKPRHSSASNKKFNEWSLDAMSWTSLVVHNLGQALSLQTEAQPS
jgi:hypothetical protein